MKKFMRTRSSAPPPPPAPPPAPAAHYKGNGHANGGGAGGAGSGGAWRDEQRSGSSRCCDSWGDDGGAGGRGGGRRRTRWGGAPLWEDAQFPCEAALGDKRLHDQLQWLRPHYEYASVADRGRRRMSDPQPSQELCASPTYWCSDEEELDELEEGGEGGGDAHGRWRVGAGGGAASGAGGAALAGAAGALALAGARRLLARAAPPHSFRARYTGAFRFRFWVFGEWRQVLVDDRLPARRGVPLALRPAARHDFTLPLLEKAYAKLYGSYAAVRGCSRARALQELTGGIVQSFAPGAQPRALMRQVLASAVPRSTLLVASAPAAPPCCVTGLGRARDGGGAMVRLRGPGPDVSPRPTEFWMPFEEFCAQFSSLELVHVGPDDWAGEAALRGQLPWRAVLARRRWRRGLSAGGPPTAPTAHTNPAFGLSVPPAPAPAAGEPDACHVVVALAQRYSPRRAARLHAVGFAVYEGGPGGRALDVTHECRAREVATFFTLPAGRYTVVPYTSRAHTDAAFLLRVYTDRIVHVWEVNEDNVIHGPTFADFYDDRPPSSAASEAESAGSEREVEAGDVQAALAAALGGSRWAWRGANGGARLRLGGALVALRDAALRGRVAARDLPALLRLVRAWRGAWPARPGARVSSYRLRGLLRDAGVAASNKVLEALTLRLPRRDTVSLDDFLLALATLHLAHERYRHLDARMKWNPLSLEEVGAGDEQPLLDVRFYDHSSQDVMCVPRSDRAFQMILMTIYS